ncbi:hypothetical protein Q0O85_20310 [Priestia megaterium]|uniref:hypothetical protein n=1 Tax=Priestia megaterium TaxID=1404 RepID=UPI001F1475A7|nr:hypothetical protein [Priestia megaterium]UMZ35493.1 hypothetical protein MGJ28_12710 [Priestia megaterium]
MYESEPNNDFKIVDTLLNERVTFGQFEDTLDIDFYKVNVSGKLEYLGSEYDDSVLESLWNEGDKERAKLCTKENGFSSSL